MKNMDHRKTIFPVLLLCAVMLLPILFCGAAVADTGFSVTLSGGLNAVADKAAIQQNLAGAMETVTYTALPGFHFAPFDGIVQDGITVTRATAATVRVSGTPETNVSLTVPDTVSDLDGLTIDCQVNDDTYGASKSTEVMQINVSHKDDISLRFHFTLAASETAPNDYKAFRIDQYTGIIKPAGNGIFDLGRQTDYSFRVVITHPDDPTLSTYKDFIFTMKPKKISVNVSAVDRDYEKGNTSVSLTGGTVRDNDILFDDEVIVDMSSAAGNMADDSAGTGKPVTVTGVKLAGMKAECYTLSEQPSGVTVNINKIGEPGTINDTAVVTVGGNTVDLSQNVTGAVGEVFCAFDGDANGCTLDECRLTSGNAAGSCKVKVTIKESTNHTEKTGTIEVTISDKKTADLAVSQANAVYGTALPDPDWIRPDGTIGDAVISYSGTTAVGAACGPDCKKPTEAGSYTVTVTEETKDTIYTGSADFTISRADPDVTPPKAKEGLVCSGSAQELVTAGTVTGGTMQYVLGSDANTAPASGWGTAVPKGTDAGTYHVWYQVSGDANHLDTNPACISVTIKKALVNPEPDPEPSPDPNPSPDPEPSPDPNPDSGIEEKVTLKKLRISKTRSLSNHKAKISWKKLSRKQRKSAQMIEIQVCVNRDFKSNVITKKVKSGKSSAVISGLEKGRKYYVRIRAYTEDGNIRYVSKWSKVKSFTIIKTFKK